MLNHKEQIKYGYYIHMRDDLSWYLSSCCKEFLPWLDKISYIMQLDAGAFNSGGMLTVSGSNTESDNLAEHGWQHHDLGSVCMWSKDCSPDIICKINAFATPEDEIVAMWNILYPFYKKAIYTGGLPIHAALIEHKGRAVLLAASGDTGKSTCCIRLPGHWNALCDDEALVVKSEGGGYRVHPFPTWSDYLWRNSKKTWDVQKSTPLHGIFFIEQSKKDKAEFLGTGFSAVSITESSTQTCRKYWRRSDVEFQRKSKIELFNNACEMAKKIPAFKLKVSLHGRFWEEIERVMGW